MNKMNEIDEDLIPAYTCVVCGMSCCKDEVYTKMDGLKCVCIDCGEKEQ